MTGTLEPHPASPGLSSLPPGYRALVAGASGAIGRAFVQAFRADPRCGGVGELSRTRAPSLRLEDEDAIAAAVKPLASQAPFDCVVDATGALTLDGHAPEKHLGALSHDRLLRQFEVNAVGPALLFKHLLPLLPMDRRAIYAKLSARVGSLGDNRLGGWYGYRAAKAALNMLLHTAAIEAARRRPQLVVALLQPGTVRSALSSPFVAAADALAPETSVAGLLKALDGLSPQAGAQFIDWRGQPVAW